MISEATRAKRAATMRARCLANGTAWTDGQLAALRELYRTIPAHEIGARLGKSAEAVHKVAKRLGLAKPRARSHAYTADDDARIVAMRADGALLQMIADAIGATRDAIHQRIQALRKRGVAVPSVTVQSAVRVRAPTTGVRPRLGIDRGEPWSGTADARLRQLWAEGLSTSEIGRRLGRSRNSVIGRAHRLGLPGRPSPIKPSSGEGRASRRLPAAKRGVPLPKLASELTPETGEPSARSPHRNLWGAFTKAANKVPRDTLHIPRVAPVFVGPSCACQWIEGDPRQRPVRFCEAPSLPGRSWCRDHYERVYVRTARQEAA